MKLAPNSAEVYLARGGSYHQLGAARKGLGRSHQGHRTGPAASRSLVRAWQRLLPAGRLRQGPVRPGSGDALAAGLQRGRGSLRESPKALGGSQECGAATASTGAGTPAVNLQLPIPRPRRPSRRCRSQFQPPLSSHPCAHSGPCSNKAAAPSIAATGRGTAQEHEARGRAFTQSEKFPEALAELNQAIQLAPNSSHAYNARGYVYLRQHDYQHALADFNDAIRLEPNYAQRVYESLRDAQSAGRCGGRGGGSQSAREPAAWPEAFVEPVPRVHWAFSRSTNFPTPPPGSESPHKTFRTAHNPRSLHRTASRKSVS